MASIVHKKDGRICIKHKVGNKWEWEHLGRGPAAQELAERKVYDYNINAAPPPHVVQFGELVVRYLQSRVHMAPTNRDKLTYRFRASILPILDVDAMSINHATLHNYITERQGRGIVSTDTRTGAVIQHDPPSMQTIQAEISNIMTVLNWAAYRCQPPLISDNPAKGFQKGPRSYAIIEPPTEKEISSILAHSSPHLYRAVILDIMTGARPGVSELFRMTWDNVNFAKNTITVLSANKGGISHREIPMSESLQKHLLKWREEDLKSGDKYLIHYRGKPVLSLQTAWTATKKRAGIARRLRFYDFRHWWTSKMLMGGADLKSVAQMLGSSVEMIWKHYQHTATSMKRAAINMLPEIAVVSTGTTDTTAKKKTAKKIHIKQVVNR